MPLILNKDKYKGMTEEEVRQAQRKRLIKIAMEKDGLTRKQRKK